MVDLSTTYMGLGLRHPIVPSASPLSRDLGTIRAMEDAGASAIVLYSLFEEQIEYEVDKLEHFLTHGSESYPEALSYFPPLSDYARGPDDYLEHIRLAKDAVDIPIIASLNGISSGGWTGYAKDIEQAGADALELNVYFVATGAELFALDVETLYVDVLRAVKRAVTIPVAMKLSPYFTALANFVERLDAEAADALVLFNRFYQPDIDLDRLEVTPNLLLSSPQEMRLPLRWIAILYGQLDASLALSSGVHTAGDAVKAVMAGADVVNVCSVLLKEGMERIGEIVDGMRLWMEEHEYVSVAQMKGSMSQKSIAEPAAYERANYIRALTSYQ